MNISFFPPGLEFIDYVIMVIISIVCYRRLNKSRAGFVITTLLISILVTIFNLLLSSERWKGFVLNLGTIFGVFVISFFVSLIVWLVLSIVEVFIKKQG